MSQKVPALRVEIATAMTARNPVVIEVDGPELERLGAMSVRDGLEFLLSKNTDHITARHASAVLNEPFASARINGKWPPMHGERMGRFIEPQRGPVSGEGPDIQTLRILAVRQQGGG